MSEGGIRASFTNAARHIVDEGEFDLTSVGVDIGSSTSHLVFSRLHMECIGSRYKIVRREIISESDILLTPYIDGEIIDAAALGAFIEESYAGAGLDRREIDTGALILTGVAVRRRNARAIADLFAAEAGRFVAVSAGDALEATMAAHGSGAVERSRRMDGIVMNVDVGGGTSKIAICERGRVREVTAIEVGARLLAVDDAGRITRLEEAGRAFAKEAGVSVALGRTLTPADMDAIVAQMTDRLMEVVALENVSPGTEAFLRLPPLAFRGKVDAITFSGGVSEFIYGRTGDTYGDFGANLGAAILDRVRTLGVPVEEPAATIRATVIGASQYTIQVSGNTIFIHPIEAVPVRNVPVIAPAFDLAGPEIDAGAVHDAIEGALARLDLSHARQAVAVALRWQGSATFGRLHEFCTGLREGMRAFLAKDHPLILVNDGDIGGLLGLHLTEEMKMETPVISIDGIELKEFDFIDIGALIPSSGAVPVVIKSLVFPATA
ncbi:MAG TPA: ethanolamine ammonia-lyase reactivating factor EutA [Alphaproteobacteria bacterium]